MEMITQTAGRNALGKCEKGRSNEEGEAADAETAHENSMIFPIGEPNDGFARYFTGHSYLAPVSTEQVGIFNVTILFSENLFKDVNLW